MGSIDTELCQFTTLVEADFFQTHADDLEHSMLCRMQYSVKVLAVRMSA